jgi:hypothetical protein
MARTTAASAAAALAVCIALLSSAAAALPLVGLDGALLTDGTCRTSTVAEAQRFDFNLIDAESEAGHYAVSVKKAFNWNATDVVLNISFFFQCTRRRTLVPRYMQAPKQPSTPQLL